MCVPPCPLHANLVITETACAQRRYIVYPADQPRLSDEEVDVSELTVETLEPAAVDGDVLTSLEGVVRAQVSTCCISCANTGLPRAA